MKQTVEEIEKQIAILESRLSYTYDIPVSENLSKEAKDEQIAQLIMKKSLLKKELEEVKKEPVKSPGELNREKIDKINKEAAEKEKEMQEKKLNEERMKEQQKEIDDETTRCVNYLSSIVNNTDGERVYSDKYLKKLSHFQLLSLYSLITEGQQKSKENYNDSTNENKETPKVENDKKEDVSGVTTIPEKIDDSHVDISNDSKIEEPKSMIVQFKDDSVFADENGFDKNTDYVVSYDENTKRYYIQKDNNDINISLNEVEIKENPIGEEAIKKDEAAQDTIKEMLKENDRNATFADSIERSIMEKDDNSTPKNVESNDKYYNKSLSGLQKIKGFIANNAKSLLTGGTALAAGGFILLAIGMPALSATIAATVGTVTNAATLAAAFGISKGAKR